MKRKQMLKEIQHSIPDKLKDYFKGFLIPQVSTCVWAETYNISMLPIACKYCGHELNANIPFFYSQIRGIIFHVCQCDKSPKNQAPFVFVRSNVLERQKDIEDIKFILGV